MKQYKLIPQETDDFCLCSCIQAIFKNYNLNVAQENVAQNLTLEKQGYSLYDENIKSFFTKNRFAYTFFDYDKTPFNEPDFLLNENLDKDIIIGVNHHSFLLLDFKDPELCLLDPKDALTKKNNLFQLIQKMHNIKSGGFGLVKKI